MKKNSFGLVLLGFLFVSSLLTSGGAQAQTKLGLVDLQKAIQSTEAGKKAKKDLESEVEKKKKDIQKREADLKKMQEDLEKKKGLLSDEIFQKRQAEFQEEMLKYREAFGKSQADLQKRERELTQPILEKMKKIVDRLAKQKGLQLIIENSPMVLFSDASIDLTNEVVLAFEKEK
jgi:outer membrane protein